MDKNIIDYFHLKEAPLLTLLTKITTGFMFVNIGTVKKIHNENYIDVSLYWTDNTGDEIVIPDVRLLKLGTNKVKLYITPEEGDNVLIICPRDFIESLVFERKPEAFDFAQSAYSVENMCAILVKDESDENVKTTVSIKQNGDIKIQTDGDIDASSKKTITMDGDNFGGLCKTPELVKQLGYLTTRVDTIINALSNSATGSQDGGAAYKTGITSILETIKNKEDFSQIENDNIKHGDNSSS